MLICFNSAGSAVSLAADVNSYFALDNRTTRIM